MLQRITNDTVLTRETKAGKSFFQLSNNADGKLKLKDIEQGTEFYLEAAYLESLVEAGKFQVAEPSELAEILNKMKVSKSHEEIRDSNECQRRLQYVTGAIESNIPCSLPKLTAYISVRSLEIVDVNPPSAPTLYRWIRAYKNSGQNESSLIPNYKKAGNRTAKIDEKHDVLITNFLTRADHSCKLAVVYHDYLEAVAEFNAAQHLDGENSLIPISTEAMRKRLRRLVP